MKRNYQANDLGILNSPELNQRIAYHEAGHATAIYLYNKQKQLPPIYFQIKLKSSCEFIGTIDSFNQHSIAAKVEGGYLIENLMLSFVGSQADMNESEKSEYQKALESDIVNLLAGAVAEANYVSLSDNEILNAHLLTVAALKHYGSQADLSKISEYLACLSPIATVQQQKLTQLLHRTFEFIAHPKHWKSVQAVANFILTCKKQVISCEEVFAVIDAVNP
jgi:hypothetical protein